MLPVKGQDKLRKHGAFRKIQHRGCTMPLAISNPKGTPQKLRKKEITSKSIDGITDLVVWAPIKEGFVDAFSNVTYETRLRQVAEGLHAVRKSAREHEKLSPFPDTAERILSLLDYRIGIVDENLYRYEDLDGSPLPWEDSPPREGEAKKRKSRPRRFMYLVATFDGPWEPYMRLIWKPLGPFLDLLLCNCEGYVTAGDNSFERYAQWVRDHQLDSGIFYSTSGQTVKDKKYLRKLERLQRELPAEAAYEKIARMTSDDPAVLATEVRSRPENQREITRLALEALTVLYKLADFYPPDKILDEEGNFGEGAYLLRVAKEILAGWSGKGLPDAVREIYKDPLSWYETPGNLFPDLRTPDQRPDETQIQKGLLTSYDPAKDKALTHGQLYLMRIEDPALAKVFLKSLPVSYETPQMSSIDFGPFLTLNVAFTHKGLKKIGLNEDLLAAFPKEFREGMESRATSIGDIWDNHPRRWALPPRNFPPAPKNEAPRPPVELCEVDVVLQLRTNIVKEKEKFTPFSQNAKISEKNLDEIFSGNLKFSSDFDPLSTFSNSFLNDQISNTEAYLKSPQETLKKFEVNLLSTNKGFDELSLAERQSEMEKLVEKVTTAHSSGMTVLSVQDMFRPGASIEAKDGLATEFNAPEARDHFGFRDGLSQPVPTATPSKQTDVPFGDILLGYKNSNGDYPTKAKSEIEATRIAFFKNGSFLAIRKMKQNALAFHDFLDRHYGQVGCTREELAAQLMGRSFEGKPLIASVDNEFDYSKDPQGERCPFASHIRRANPRSYVQGRKDPLILRRGMSYGYKFNPAKPDDDRGIVFMAHCASLAEQYEIIQRWVNGGNSTGVSSSHTDPIVGLHPRHKKNMFRFIKNGKVHNLEIDVPFTQVEWGLYLFTPSRDALDSISQKREIDPTESTIQLKIDAGNKILASLENLDPKDSQLEWKRILEDFLTKDPEKNDISPKVAAAIEDKGGAYLIKNGVASNHNQTKPEDQRVILITNKTLIQEVFEHSSSQKYSSCEQGERMSRPGAFGMIYVARDPDTKGYKDEAYPTNEYLLDYDEETAFFDGYAAGMKALTPLKLFAKMSAPQNAEPIIKLEIGRQYVSEALGWLCHSWFGVPDNPPFLGQNTPSPMDEEYIAKGPWQWAQAGCKRSTDSQPVCPGDFMSPSRDAFYPRPTSSISDYGLNDGKRLRNAVSKLIKSREETGLSGTIGAKMWAAMQHDPQLLERNLIGIMIGALPPMDANLRFAFYEWLSQNTLWEYQSKYQTESRASKNLYDGARAILRPALMKSMSIRPAPDLIYRTAKSDMNLGEVKVQKGDLVILNLASATQKQLAEAEAKGEAFDVDLVFGGKRAKGEKPTAPHACPAMDMAMGGMMGILAAFLDSGRIQALPASLIVQLTGWPPVKLPG